MHTCCLIFTKEFPSDNILHDKLAPFDERLIYSEETDKDQKHMAYPAFVWDWWEVGGRYAGQIKLTIDENDKTYNWNFCEKEPRSDRLFRSYLLDEIKSFAKQSANGWMFREENYYSSMGSYDGFLYVDGAKMSDIGNIEDVGCFCYIDKDGNAYARTTWNGSELIKHPDFDERLKNVISNSADCYVCVVDLHD